MAKSKLAKLMEKERRKRGLSLRELAEKIGCTAMAISYVETGVTTKGKLIETLADFYTIEPSYLKGICK
jgi:transcriptional regulator with XRE-family HTH domain